MNISAKIKKIRELKGYSQEYVASELGISQAAYSKIEKNDKNLSIERIKTISLVLEIDPLELINFNVQNIFNNCKNDNFGNKGNYYAFSENERDLYEKTIERLEKEVAFLKKTIEGLL